MLPRRLLFETSRSPYRHTQFFVQILSIRPPGTGAKILGAWGLGAGDLGSYSLCESIALQVTDAGQSLVHYCWMGKDITSAIGLCVPWSCTQHVLVRNARLIVSVVEHVSYNKTVDDWQAGCTVTGEFGTTSIVSAVTILCLCAFVVASSVAAVRKRCSKLMERGCDCVGKSSARRRGEEDEVDVWSGWSPSNGGGRPHLNGMRKNSCLLTYD